MDDCTLAVLDPAEELPGWSGDGDALCRVEDCVDDSDRGGGDDCGGCGRCGRRGGCGSGSDTSDSRVHAVCARDRVRGMLLFRARQRCEFYAFLGAIKRAIILQSQA